VRRATGSVKNIRLAAKAAPYIRIGGSGFRVMANVDEGLVIPRKVDIMLHGKGNSNSHGARPVYSNHLDEKVDSDQ